MDGRLRIERGDVMQLVELLRANAPWDRGGSIGGPSRLRRLRNRIGFARARAVNNAIGARGANVAHHYDIGNDFYRLMLDAEHMQYSCALLAARRHEPRRSTGSQARPISPPSWHSSRASACSISAAVWGRDGDSWYLFLALRAGVTVHGITLSEEQLALAPRARRSGRGSPTKVSFELVDYRELPRPRYALRPDRIGRHVRTCRPATIRDLLSQLAPT